MFSPTSGKGNSFEPLPHGTLAFVQINVRDLKTAKSGGTYLYLELAVVDHPQFTGRRIFSMLPNVFDPKCGDDWIEIGKVSWVRLLEAVGAFNPEHPGTYNQFMEGPLANATPQERIQAMAKSIHEKVGAVKIKLVPEKNGFEEKNEVAEWLSPNKQTVSGYKGWQKLMAGSAAPISPAAPVASAPAFATPVPAPTANAAAKPAWL